jgi:dihydroflavonol-4-reductase
MTETVLVTGGTGFVASWCIAELLERGYDVRTTVRSLGKEPQVRAAAAVSGDPGDRLSVVEADLTADAGWDAATAGVDYVLHVAQPMGEGNPADPDELIRPARDGALRVLRAAAAAGVNRVVMTSAANAASPSSYADDGVTDENLWTDPEDPTLIPYRRAKTIGEKTAWDFMAGYAGPMTLATVLPGAVFGPIRSTSTVGSVGIIARMLQGKMPGSPRIALEIVDVRDLAEIHIRAMTAPEAAGQRFLATGEFMWMSDMARALRECLGPAASKVSTRTLPDFVLRLAARFRDPSLQAITPALGRRARHSTAKAQCVLGWEPRPAVDTVVDCATSLIEWRVV